MWTSEFESILRKFEEARIDTPTYRGILGGIAQSKLTFSSRRNAQYFTELLHYKGMLDKTKALNIKEGIAQSPGQQLQKPYKNFFEHLLDTAISNEALPANFTFEPFRVNKLSLLLRFPTKLYTEKLPSILDYVSNNEILSR